MRSDAEIAKALALAREGVNDCEIARRTGIPRSTIRHWRIGSLPRRHLLATSSEGRASFCSRCGAAEHDPTKFPRRLYAYLLGLYLGDGCLACHRRGVYRLRIALDSRYPGIISECAEAVRGVMPANRVLVLGVTTVDIQR